MIQSFCVIAVTDDICCRAYNRLRAAEYSEMPGGGRLCSLLSFDVKQHAAPGINAPRVSIDEDVASQQC